MIANISEVLRLLGRYAKGEINLEAMHDQLSLGLHKFFESASEEDTEILSEIHSALYEVEDGVLDEESFRSAVAELVEAQLYPSTITVGHPPPTSYPPYLVGTSTSSGNVLVEMYAV